MSPPVGGMALTQGRAAVRKSVRGAVRMARRVARRPYGLPMTRRVAPKVVA